MRVVVEECGIDTSWMKAADMRLFLGNHCDFKFENSAHEQLMLEWAMYLLYIYQGFTDSIERVWGEAQQYILI